MLTPWSPSRSATAAAASSTRSSVSPGLVLAASAMRASRPLRAYECKDTLAAQRAYECKERRMRAVVVERYGPPSVARVEQAADPEPSRGEVVVRVAAAAVTSGDAR